MDYSVELVADYSCHIGENPIWHSDQQVLYWLDIPQGHIFRFDPHSGHSELFFQTGVVGGMTIQEDGDLLLFMEAGHIALLKNGKLTSLVENLDEETGKRFNDVIATPSGSVFCGTFSYSFSEGDTGSLYCFKRDGTVKKMISEVGIANGMGFSPDLRQFYFTDSLPARRIYRYLYNREDDTLHSERVFAHLPAEKGLPDGLTVDSDGHVWSARWDGGRVIRFTPSGDTDLEFEIPGAKKVSSVTFGGPDYTDMYVTTAGGNDKSENGDNAGALFRIRADRLQGTPEYRSGIELTGA